MNFKKLNNIVGWGVFAIATIVYFLTMEPTVSWWDCGEYISTANKLQVGHPPGAPTFQLIGRFFTLFAFGDVTKVAMMINVMSCLCSSFTILFLFWTISMLAQKIWMRDGEKAPKNNQLAVLAASAIGALAFTFTDSFWFNAVEGEVYAMSSLLTAITFWAILKWEQVSEEPNHYRWLIFIAYIIGLSIGVHLLNLLAIPAIVYVVYFKKYKFSWKGFIWAGILAVAITGFIQVILIPAIVSLAGKFELFFVNSLGLPFNFGTIFYFVLIIALIVWGLWYTTKMNKPVWNTIILSFMFILIGYSSFFMLVIRANANTPINENEPKDAISMLSYLKREQYGSWPLLYGPYYMAKPYDMTEGTPIYYKDHQKGRYVEIAKNPGEYVYDDNVQTIFPRMWNGSKKTYTSTYERYIDKSNMRVTTQKKPNGTTERVMIPTFGQNLRFFLDYQCGWMFWRYFMWNFVGRQNDTEGQGEIEHGNWVSGIGFIDNARLGNQKDLPRSMQSAAHTEYYFLPLILGLVGLFYQLKRDPRNCWVVFLLFFMTGVAIIMYLNQTPYQPRERDYSYAGAFYAFAIWMGFGVLGVIEGLKKLVKNQQVATWVATAVCLFVPILMAAQGWEGHDRSGKTSALDWGKNYLTALPQNAVIFTRGDNDTFPLWYVQEVEGYRTDVRVCNFMLSSGYWYVHQMGRKIYESEKLPLSLTPAQYDNGVHEQIWIQDVFEGPVELKDVIDFVRSDNPRTKGSDGSGKKVDYFPTRNLKLTVDKEKVVANGIVPENLKDKIVDEIVWTIPEKVQYLTKNEIMLLDFMATNNWERCVYFTSLSDIADILGIDKYLHQQGLSHRFMPVEAPEYYKGAGGVFIDGSYDLLVNNSRWGRLNEPDVTVDPESFRNISFIKMAYMRLAKAYVSRQRYEEAITVMDKCQEFFPDEKIPYGFYYEGYFPDLYYKAGAMEKGDDVLRKIAANATDELRYYKTLSPKFAEYYKDNIHDALSLVNTMADSAKRNRRYELQEELDKVVNDYLDYFLPYL
jgi:Amino acid transporters